MPANEYYDSSGSPATSSSGSSAVVRAEFDAIEVGFNKLPTLSGKSNQVVHINSSGAAMTSTSGFSFDGTTLSVPAITTSSGLTIGGNLLVNGNTTLGDASSDAVTVTAKITSNLIFTDNTYDIGAAGATRPRTVYAATSAITPVVDSGAASQISFKTNTGSEQFRVSHIASSVNFFAAAGAALGNAPSFGATGSDTNIGINVYSKGTGTIGLYTNAGSTLQFQVAHTASAVNYMTATGGTAGNDVVFAAQGSDSNVNIDYVAKGTGGHIFFTNGGGTAVAQFKITHVATAVNWFTAHGQGTGNAPALGVDGSDTNIGMVLYSKGTGAIDFYTGAGANQQFRVTHTASAVNFMSTSGSPTGAGSWPAFYALGSDANISAGIYSKAAGFVDIGTNGGTSQFRIVHVASAVNYWQANGHSVGNTPAFGVVGSDTNIAAQFYSKGAGSLVFYTNAGSQQQFAVSHTASAVNYVQVTGNATANPVVVSAEGADTNISFVHRAKGTGSHFFQTASGTEQFRVSHVASAVNFLQAFGGATGNNPGISATASGDTNVGVNYTTKGTGSHNFFTSSTAQQFQIIDAASAVNFIQATGAGTGVPPGIGGTGSDSNVALTIFTKGTGAVTFATNAAATTQFQILHTASASRFITVTGSNGGNPTITTSAGSLAITPSVVGAAGVSAYAATAIPAGGTAGTGFTFSSTANFGVFFGSNVPSLSAAKGSLYLRSDGSSSSTRAYINTDGGTTWTAVTTAA